MYFTGGTIKKYFYLSLLIICILSFGIVKATIEKSKLELIGKVIYIDPGHGGLDPGTIYKNIYEKDLNLQISKKLKSLLEKEGAIVYLTRYDDYDLAVNNVYERKKSDLNNRAKIINKSKADLYVSIHLNSIASSTWNGAQVFYDDINSNNKKIAILMQKVLKKELKTKREVKEISNMLMNRKITIPGILIEVGFLSNPNERYLLQKSDYQYRICEAIKKGIIKYFH